MSEKIKRREAIKVTMQNRSYKTLNGISKIWKNKNKVIELLYLISFYVKLLVDYFLIMIFLFIVSFLLITYLN